MTVYRGATVGYLVTRLQNVERPRLYHCLDGGYVNYAEVLVLNARYAVVSAPQSDIKRGRPFTVHIGHWSANL